MSKIVKKTDTEMKNIKKEEKKPVDTRKDKKNVEIKKEKDVDNKNEKPSNEIKSLKQMEEIILEKLEDHKPEITIKEAPEIEPVREVKLISEETKDYKSQVEAILFAVGKYLDDEMISQLCEIDKRTVKKALEELKKDYDSRNTALTVIQEGNSWKINVREKYLTLVRKVVADTELSKTVMETLAVIAWKTPVYQNEIVKIRGNKCYDHIEELETAGFVTKDKKGRSYILKTTDKFYNYFDIDQKNLKGVMSEAKMPVVQTTLEEEKPQETPYSREKLLQALETIETKSITHTEEDKNSQRDFLNQIHEKIEAAAQRTNEVVAEIPRPMHEQIEPVIETVPEELHSDTVIEKDEDEIVINTETADSDHHFQKPEEKIQKPKSLTKKQLEKKFKDELLRVKEKSK